MTAFEPDRAPDDLPRLLDTVESGGCSERVHGQRDCVVRYKQGRRVLDCYGPCGLAAVVAELEADPDGRDDTDAPSRAPELRVVPLERAQGGRGSKVSRERHEAATLVSELGSDPGAESSNGVRSSANEEELSQDATTQGETARPGKHTAPATASMGIVAEPDATWPWPEPLDPKVYSHSVAGHWASYLDEREITEADPAAVFLQTLTALGAMVGLRPRLHHGILTIPPKWFLLVVGDSARGRKGTALDCAAQLLHELDESFMRDRVLSGFGSGEALIRPVADDNDDFGADGSALEPERRLLVLQTEFASFLRVAERPNSTLSPNIRDLYDMGPVRNITKNETLVASQHHVALIGHITPTELRSELKETALSNGFGSRLLMVAARRSRLISRPAPVDALVVERLADQLREAVTAARDVDTVGMTDAALDRWDHLYLQIESRELPPIVATLTHRASPLTLRIALLHALLAGRQEIEADDLDVAAEIVRYGTDTVLHLFGDRLLDERAELLLEAARSAGPEGLNGRQRTKLFNNNLAAGKLNDLMESLVSVGLCQTLTTRPEGGGRPSTVLVAVEHAATAVLLYGGRHSA